jgi:hypothetical protein
MLPVGLGLLCVRTPLFGAQLGFYGFSVWLGDKTETKADDQTSPISKPKPETKTKKLTFQLGSA